MLRVPTSDYSKGRWKNVAQRIALQYIQTVVVTEL